MTTKRALTWTLAALAVALAANAVLGPLGLDAIDYRYSEAMINQAIGLDAVALLFAAPLAAAAATLVAHGHRSGPVLAFAPATFAAYMMPQYVIGPDYLGLPGNNERAIPFHIATMVLAIASGVLAWRQLSGQTLAPDSVRSDRRRGWILVGVAVFTAVGRGVPSMVHALGGEPSDTYLDNPTAFWLVGLLDLGLIVPAAITAAVALRHAVPWARTAAFAVVGWFSLVPASVAAMAIVMQINGDPLASTSNTTTMTAVAVVLTIAAARLYHPLFASDEAQRAAVLPTRPNADMPTPAVTTATATPATARRARPSSRPTRRVRPRHRSTT